MEATDQTRQPPVALITVRYPDGDELLFDLPYTENVLEVVFARLNRGSGQEDLEVLEGHRSMMVGDEVAVTLGEHTTRWICMSAGWQKAPEVDV